MIYTLSNNLSTSPENCNVGYNNSWILVENDAQRKLFAQASYVTNFEDFTVSLSAGDITIGSVEIKDGNSNLKADVASANGYNALRVISQDLESDVDDITIGDRNKNYATIIPAFSALKVYPVIQGGGFTKCETKTSGTPSFISEQILLYNPNNNNMHVDLTLVSGMSCSIPLGKKDSFNHSLILNLSVLTVNNYSGCEITFFA
jgi:hypothetical protein